MLFHHSRLISLKYPIRIQYIIPVFYHEIINTVNDSDDGPPADYEHSVHGVVPLHIRWSRLRIIEEMQLFRALSAAFIHSSLGQMGNQLTAENRTVKYSFVESMPFARGCLPRAWQLLYPVYQYGIIPLIFAAAGQSLTTAFVMMPCIK